ncbi:MAG: hypothetical protein E6H07_14935 [Bacteroidetes bacterium]|nr:MAG: hypothetical protein E6H07_14935 [Bacteroidota bacterium]
MREDLNTMRDELERKQQLFIVLAILWLLILSFQIYFQSKKISEYKKKRDETEDIELKAAYNKEVNKRVTNIVLNILIPVIIVLIIFGLA